jgi:hypothetical protein
MCGRGPDGHRTPLRRRCPLSRVLLRAPPHRYMSDRRSSPRAHRLRLLCQAVSGASLVYVTEAYLRVAVGGVGLSQRGCRSPPYPAATPTEPFGPRERAGFQDASIGSLLPVSAEASCWRIPRGCGHSSSGANRDRTGDLLLAKHPLPRPTSASIDGDLQDFLVTGLGAKIGADARGLSAIIVVSGTFANECLNGHRSIAMREDRGRAQAKEGRPMPASRRKQAPGCLSTRRLSFVRCRRRPRSNQAPAVRGIR